MDEKMEKIDEIIKRIGVSYEIAQTAYENAGGDLLEALVIAESIKNEREEKNEDLKKKGEEILSELKKIINKGNTNRITIKKDNEVILNVPVTAGAIGFVFAPFFAIAGLTAAMLTKCSIEIQQVTGEVINLNTEVEKGYNKVKTDVESIINNSKNEE